MKLPRLYEQRMKEYLVEEYQEYISCFNKKYFSGVRVNTLKLSPEEFLRISPFSIKRIPFIKKGFYYEESDQPSKHPFYYAGLYYIQEPSAMTPASLLPIESKDKVLDLCAAPGGKSTELGTKLCKEGLLVSNDISNSRAKALLKNIEMFGIKNAIVMSESPAKLAKVFPEFFDKILVDAPCSGEGMFRKSPAIMKNWEQYGVGYYNKLQKEILPFAVSMLKEGGYLLYSTCTFSKEEDEEMVLSLLKQFKDLSLMPPLLPEIMNQVENCMKEEVLLSEVSYDGFSFGRPEWVKEEHDLKQELKKCIRLWPHKIDGEGHFIALFQKTKSNKVAYADKDNNRIIEYDKKSKGYFKSAISHEAELFLKQIKMKIDTSLIEVRENRLYLLPEGIKNLSNLRILRSGLLLGEQKKGRFEPSQALACALKIEEYDNVYSFHMEDEDVFKYLRCESIELKQEVKDGWVLVCIDVFPLGWGKVINGRFKNKYLAGWRMM